MNKYEHSKICKNVNDVDGMLCVGSTTEPSDERWRKHIDEYARLNSKHKLHKKN